MKTIAIPQTIRVAVYARQSVEDATSDFGSIQAQREAVEAYARSQQSLGWRTLPEQFCDAGFSGSNTHRPAFQRLMEQVRAGQVDVVAVYRLDRISRSLADFVGIMRDFREHDVEFVSITQGFSTTTSVGRMTVNLLATFAEFERECISERTRDKMCSARKRGMWTGGAIPLGYDLVAGKLVVNAAEADTVRSIFRIYLDTRSILATVQAANARGLRTKTWTTNDGKTVPARAWLKNTISTLLSNPVYIGRVRLHGDTHEGLHEPIVPQETFDAVQALRRSGETPARNKHGALLRGLLQCAVCGSTMAVASTKKRSRRYLAYVCQRAQKQGAAACPGSRVAVPQIEAAVLERVRAIGRDPELVEQTMAAVRRELASTELEEQIARHERTAQNLERERTRLIDAMAQGGTTSVMTRVAELDAELAEIAATIERTRGEIALRNATKVDETELRRALESLMWRELQPDERARVIRALIKHVTFDGRTREVGIELR